MISVDGLYIANDTSKSLTIYQFLSKNNIVIPCFCYHEKLNIAGNCRMCLVEANGAMVVSCAMPLLPDMQIITSSERLAHSRENVLEFLLANHPLDCPICDQGGECDLQDISKTYGSDRGRFYESKRSVNNLNCFSSMVKTLMTRCIHCTRCVRFLNGYSNEGPLGTLGRGSAMEIGSFISSVFIEDPLSANIIDLCPVGALTSMPNAFKARPWEYKSIESIDIMDSMANNIRFDVVNNRIVRCLPVISENFNEDWMTNKARFVYYSIMRQEAISPSLKIGGNFVPISWRQAALLLFDKIFVKKTHTLFGRTGNFIDLETALLFKHFCLDFGGSEPVNENCAKILTDYRKLFLMQALPSDLEDTTLILLIGCDLRIEIPLLYLRVRRNFYKRKSTKKPLRIYLIGCAPAQESLPIIQLGSSLSSIDKLVTGRLNGFKDFFFNGFIGLHLFGIYLSAHPKPRMLIGSAVLNSPKAAEIQAKLWNFSKKWEKMLGRPFSGIYNVALDYLGKISMLTIGCGGNTTKSVKDDKKAALFYNLFTETVPSRKNPEDFIVYQGVKCPSNLDIDLFLPSASPLEWNCHYINVFGFLKSTRVVLSPLKTTLTDPQILRFLHRYSQRIPDLDKHIKEVLCEKELSFPWKGDLKEGLEKHYGIPFSSSSDSSDSSDSSRLILNEPLNKLETSNESLGDEIIGAKNVDNYYEKDVFSRSSLELAKCAAQQPKKNWPDNPPSV